MLMIRAEDDNNAKDEKEERSLTKFQLRLKKN